MASTPPLAATGSSCPRRSGPTSTGPRRDAPGQPVAQPGLTTLQQVFGYDPSPDRADGANILGTQGQLWTEFLPTPQRVDDMAYPRLCALAERAWSAMDTDYADFADRLAAHALRLTAAGVTYRENSA